MATIGTVVAEGRLALLKLPEWEVRQPVRPLWVTPELLEGVRTTAALHDVALGAGGRTIAEHLTQFMCDFRCSPRLHAGDLRRMMPNKNGVWKMHPFALRIYGWAPAVHQFVAVCWALERETKSDRQLNDTKRDEVLDFVRANGLRGTITYGDINAVFPREP